MPLYSPRAPGRDSSHLYLTRLLFRLSNQQRHVLEKSYHALHSAGDRKEDVSGTTTGVVVAIWSTDFSYMLKEAGSSTVFESQNISISVASGRLSFVLGLHGPCSSIDTACSAALVASHCAFRAIENGECDKHIVTGVKYFRAASNAGLSCRL